MHDKFENSFVEGGVVLAWAKVKVKSSLSIYTDPKKNSDFQVNFACFKTNIQKMFLICIDL